MAMESFTVSGGLEAVELEEGERAQAVNKITLLRMIGSILFLRMDSFLSQGMAQILNDSKRIRRICVPIRRAAKVICPCGKERSVTSPRSWSLA